MLLMKLCSAQPRKPCRPSFNSPSGGGSAAPFLTPQLVFVTRLAEAVRSVPRFCNVVLLIDAHDQRGKDERSRSDPLVAKCSAHQQIPWAQLLVFSIFQARYNGPIFEFDRWFLRSHAISPLFFDANEVGRDQTQFSPIHRK